MGELEEVPVNSGEAPGHDPDLADEEREAALMREILRAQEQHREGGIDPELDETGEDRRPSP